MSDKLEKTDYITPFRDLQDIVDRLLPFSLNFEPDFSQEHMDMSKD